MTLSIYVINILRMIKKILTKLRSMLPFGLAAKERVVAAEFDYEYYLSKYEDVKRAGVNPLRHYMKTGWKEGRNPTSYFNTISYLLCNPDVFIAGVNPFFHYISAGRSEGRLGISEQDAVKKYFSDKLYSAIQDITFPIPLMKAEKIIVIVVPEYPTMSGGIYSMFSIANVINRKKYKHGYETVLMTRPNKHQLTYYRQQNFRNSENVYRFEQIALCRNAKELYLHVPEFASVDFVDLLPESVLTYLREREHLYINILNQNSDLMPEPHCLEKVRELAHELTQSVAHHASFTQELVDKYNLPTLLLPAYTDLSDYPAVGVEEKDQLIIYSPDDAPHKEECLSLIRKDFPQYQLKEIRNITFDQYMNLATRCKYSISFGEGFDGYVAQPIYQGGIGFTVYSEEFFPHKKFLDYDNFFESEEEMLEGICQRIKHYDENREEYIELNKKLLGEYKKLYQYDDYLKQVQKLIERKYELYPSESVPAGGVYKMQ